MKTTAALYLAAFATILIFTACTLTDQRARQLSAIAAKTLTVATAFGYIEEEEAALVEKHGALVLAAFKTDSVSSKVVAISSAAVAATAAHGEITPAQAAALYDAVTIPLPAPEPAELPAPPESVSLK